MWAWATAPVSTNENVTYGASKIEVDRNVCSTRAPQHDHDAHAAVRDGTTPRRRAQTTTHEANSDGHDDVIQAQSTGCA